MHSVRNCSNPATIEESNIAANRTYALSGRYDRDDLLLFRQWIDTYITNRAACDALCNHTRGDLMDQYPGRASKS